MGQDANQVDAGGDGAIGAGRDVHAATTGDHSPATHIETTHIEATYMEKTYVENLYVQPFPVRDVVPPPGGEAEQAALKQYAVRVRERYGRLDLDVLIPTEEGEHPPVALREVFVSPLVRADPPPVELPRDILNRLVETGDWPAELPPGVEQESLERARQAYQERPARDVLQLLAARDADRLVLLGDPGAGKSTLARHLALALTGGIPRGPLRPLAGRVPLVVELREYAAGPWRHRAFEKFLAHLHETNGLAPPPAITERLLRQGRAVVVFDGLDELFEPAAREQVAHRIADFASRYREAGVRVVVTSRVIGYQRSVLEHADFRHHMIQDLSEEQIALFARQWYAAACPHDPERADRLTRRLTQAVAHSRPVRELAGNPLLLTILAVVGRRRELPRDRQGVYRHAVAVLVAHWDEHAKHLRVPADADALSYLGDEDRHELLRLVARQMQNGRGGLAGNHIHSDELLATFKTYLCEEYELPVAEAVAAARTMVRQFRERNFIFSHYGGGVYGFVHRAFLEYLAAEDIDRRYTREREWSQEELIDEVFVRRALDPAWHEVLLLLVGQIGEREAGAALARLLALHRRRADGNDTRLLVLAVRALGEVRKIGSLAEESRAVVDEVVALFSDAALKGRHPGELRGVHPVLAGFGAHWSGRRRFLRWFHLRGQFGWSVATSAALACSLHHTRELARVVAVHYRSAVARAEAMELLAARWGHDPATWELLRERVTADRSVGCRRAALYLLGEHGGTDPELWALITERVVEDGSESVRGRALEVLGKLWPDSGDAARIVHRRALEDPSPETRWEALRLMVRRYAKGREAAVAATNLRDRAIRDPEPPIRAYALRRLVHHDRTDDTWQLVRARHTDDPSPLVRDAAARLLRYEAGDRSVVVERPAPDSAPHADHSHGHTPGDTRRLAFQALVRVHPDEPATWARVHRAMTDDADEGVRAVAVRLLGGHRGTEPGTREAIVDRCLNDPEAHVRHSALQTLARHWGDDPATRRFIRERAVADDEVRVRCAALDVLGAHWSADPESRALLRARAVDDPGSRARVWALRWSAVHEPGDTGAALTRRLATTDPHPDVRTAALWILAFGHPAAPATLPLLHSRATTDADETVRVEATRAVAAAEALAPLTDQLP
ncbi:HEAT repeat domain-containing protein [Streptomyces sp. NPDC008159]|uniref:HEAT repeat domain-containing protein n=1 Tax=Streptomyces sp. NPDC008159 TaxID=3364817 RepID=UPI0036E19974